MADLRIADAPVVLQESITDDVKMPTGGLGNFSIRLGDIVWYVVTKEQLANKNYVDLSSQSVKDSLDTHIADKNNPHQVTKVQVGLDQVDNTADIDKPVSNAVSSAIITATADMATKTYVNSRDGDLTSLTTTDKTTLVKAINEVVASKANKSTTLSGYGITDAYTKLESNNFATSLETVFTQQDGSVDVNGTPVKSFSQSIKDAIATAGVTNGVNTNLITDQAQNMTQAAINATQKTKNELWVDVTDKFADDATNNLAVLNQAIADAKSSNKGIRCAPRATVNLNADVDFSNITNIDFRANINTTGTVIIGGEANTGKPFDVFFADITNGTSVLTGAIPTIDTFRISGVKSGKVRVGSNNLLRIHAIGGNTAKGSNAYFTLELNGVVRALRVSDEGTGGWNNRIYVRGGRLVDLDVTGTGYVPNELLFDDNTFEGNLVKIRFKNAWTNRVINARFEGVSSSATSIIFESDAMSNTVIQRWSGTGATRSQFFVNPIVTDNGQGNIVTTQAAVEYDKYELFSVDAGKIIADATSSSSQDSCIGNAKAPYANSSFLQPSLTDFSASGNKMIALSNIVPVQIGDAIIFDNVLNGGKYRPIIIVYDANKQLISTDNDHINLTSKSFVASAGTYSTSADITAPQFGASVTTNTVKYVQVGIMTSTDNSRFVSLSAYIYTQNIARYRTAIAAQANTSVPMLTGDPTMGHVAKGVRVRTASGELICSASAKTYITTASVGTSVTVHLATNLSIGCIVGVIQTDGSTKWTKITAVSGTTITLADSVDVQANALFVSNKWDIVSKSASITYDPPSLATATQQSTTVTLTGAKLGDIAAVSFSRMLNGTRMWGEVTANDTVTVYHRNDTGVAVDLASGTLTVKII